MSTPDELDRDLHLLQQQEDLLRFRTFDAETAWQIGSLLRQSLLTGAAGGSVEIEVAGHLLFACATAGAQPGQANWIRRKRNTVHHFARSTYAIGRKLEREGETLMSRHALSEVDYAAHGGGFPILLQGAGASALAIGSIVFSGLPQRADHNHVVDALASLLEIEVPRLP